MGTHEGFSIREYVSRMRSVNVVKCWPFDEAISEESVKSLLPPITVKKFSWWLDGLEYLRSESSQNVDSSKKKQKRKKKMVQEKGESSLRSEDDAEESDVDVGEGMEVVKAKSSRAKAKAPKKRSILEIFAEAPPVERVSSEEGEVGENSVQEDGFCTDSNLSSHEEINWGLKGKRNEKKKEKTKKKKEIIFKLKKANKVIRKIKQKQTQKKGDDKMDSNKENCFVFKLHEQDKAIGNPNSSQTRENKNDICDRASIRKKKPRLQHLNGNKKTTACKASKLTAENQHQGKPKRGILKNHGKSSSLQQSTKCILQEAVQVNHWGNQKADKHVTFLQKGNMLRLRRKPSNPVELFNMQNFSSSDMHNVHHAGGVGKDSAIVETSGSEDVSNRTGNEVDGSPAGKEQSTIPSCIVDTSSFVKQHKKEEPFSRSVTSDITFDGKNQHSFDIGLREAPYDPKYACPPGLSCMAREANYNSQNAEIVMNSSSSTGGRLIKDLGTPGPRVPSMCFEDYLKTYREHSVSNLSTLGKGENKMPQASSQSTSLNDAHPIQYETPRHLFPRELLQTVCSPRDGYPTGNIHGKRTIHGINEDFVGLPLNSQGELITLSSRAKGNLNQIIKSSTTAAPSISLSLPSNALSKCFVKHSGSRNWDCRTSSRDQLNLFPVEGYLKENPVVFVPSRLGITECLGNGQTNLDFELIKVNDPSFHSENALCKEDSQAQKSHGNDKILSTMRLMGKDFVIGGRGFQGFEDGNIWNDKQIIDQLHFNNTSSISNIMMHDHNEPSLGELKETLFCPSEMTINHGSGSTYTFPHFDCQTSLVQQRNGFVARKINPVEKLYPGLSPGTLSAVRNSESLFLEPFPTGYKSQVLNLELPTPQAAHQDSSPKVSLSDIQMKNKQNLPHAPRSAIRFPFMHPDFGGHAQSSWSGSSHVNRPPLLFDVSKKEMPMSNSQAYHNLGGSHHCVIPGINQWTDSSVSLKPEALCLYNPFSSSSTLQSSIGLASSPPTMLTQQAPILCYPGIMPISTMEKRNGNQKKIREQIKSRIGIRGLGHGRKAKRQPSAVSSGSIKPVKMPSLGVEEGSQCAITKSTDCVNFEDVQSIEAGLDSCSPTKRSKILLHDEYGEDQNEQRIYPWIDSYSSTARTGAIKLTAGAKHILKACQQIDQTSSKSTDPNIPLAAASAGFRFSESENSTKIYKF